MSDTAQKLSKMTVALHWVVGLMMIGLLAVGVYMEENEVYSLYPIHKSLGVLILLVVLPRVINRMRNGWPEPASQYTAIENVLSRITHYLLIVGTLLMPISGVLMSAMGGRGVYVFGLELFGKNFDAIDPTKIAPINESLAGLAHSLHGWGGDILIVAIALHVIGAVKHHVIDKDGTLRRMLGKSI
ncbi:cytochrome b [uncultured Pseudoteredinibacter sp.]|uniref:cytochrome b n=1 Tax=uncultured Pseudoteredinibacter sp. TaxID=1641701 RepID=UPI002614A51F|nr:cytochrome b [uncultured Pseudoteredinibacter sp.]